MAVLYVDGVAMPDPNSISVSVQDVDYESGRDQSGYMFRDRKRGGATAVRKIECKWPPLTDSQVSTLLKAVKNASMTLTYPDPYEGKYRNATVYVGDRKAPVYYLPDKTVNTSSPGSYTPDATWNDVAFNFIEF